MARGHHGGLAAHARDLGISPSRYQQWESGASRPPAGVVREAMGRLGLAEGEALLVYLLDPFGTAEPPSWWSASGPVPLAGQARDPRWTSDPARPGDAPRLSRSTAEALQAEADSARRELAEGLVAEQALARAAADERIAASAGALSARVRERSPVSAPASLPWARVATLAGRAFEAREAGDEGALAALAEQLRALVCGSAAVPA